MALGKYRSGVMCVNQRNQRATGGAEPPYIEDKQMNPPNNAMPCHAMPACLSVCLLPLLFDRVNEQAGEMAVVPSRRPGMYTSLVLSSPY